MMIKKIVKQISKFSGRNFEIFIKIIFSRFEIKKSLNEGNFTNEV